MTRSHLYLLSPVGRRAHRGNAEAESRLHLDIGEARREGHLLGTQGISRSANYVTSQTR